MSEELKLVQIPSDAARQTWVLVEEWIGDAAKRNGERYTSDTVLVDIEAGDMQLWIIWDTKETKAQAVIISQLLEYPTGVKAADIILLTGDNRREWKHMLSTFEEWAKEQGCGLVQATLRRGWARDLPDYKCSHVLLEKQLAHP